MLIHIQFEFVAQTKAFFEFLQNEIEDEVRHVRICCIIMDDRAQYSHAQQVDRGTKTSQSLSFLLESSIPAVTAPDEVRKKHREDVMAAMSKVKQKTENLRAQAKNGFQTGD